MSNLGDVFEKASVLKDITEEGLEAEPQAVAGRFCKFLEKKLF